MNFKVTIDSLSIEDNQILEKSQFELTSGDVVAIVGPNGAGKSTLLHAIAGREDINIEGTAELDGENLLDLDITERAQAGVFLSWQHPPAIGGVSNFGLMKEIIKEDIMQLLKSYKSKLSNYSEGVNGISLCFCYQDCQWHSKLEFLNQS